MGGTFDPVHRGHVAVADQAARLLELDEVLLVAAGRPPHREAPGASPADRLAMVELAVAGHPALRASDVEVSRPGPSYAVDTLRELRRADPGREWVLLLGWDAAREFQTWHRAPEIVSLARIAVFNRTGESPPDATGLAEAGLPGDAIVLTVDSPPIAAEEIRRRLASGEDTGAEIEPAVRDYIRDHGLYASEAGS